uniref:NADP-dependent oxidoreductase domain-containing protein n=1 Tax=Chromera velia CCMP2878 TaxID=1169474 RepID=A0A0G4HU53_9ALVE|mmetsp:Transcript_18494/g.37418  ORF Transcript_18494/g.37418 Transcript_18494/m.37418 type:complete len:317 (-) Transcript_18494:794-1744(-)|eukprot:Cvel_8598.t1-p1 / transcript=Cvel_8598.t1 / gene=Cvel_8598 / organism=Chromera_velia_CCMP2878 / gene_product=Alcohol dehydrogenase [NADP( )], putative / transcript_product=Alcohol dehydrogenase [NADP( )], putative / location=Cvel_scaffold477:39796-40743(+) / protein_length=316 / sequence_SO=supercontig / SO=protein_coding / is_pseudo=false
MFEPSVKLTSGAQGSIPLIGFGTWKAESGEVKKAVKAAVAAGIRHIDCAAVYANEKEVGEALTEIFAEGKVKRGDLWITSKLWNTCHDPENVEKAAKSTIEDLKCEYLDLYLVHWPCAFAFTGLPCRPDTDFCPRDAEGNIKFAKVSLQQTWGAMEQLVEKKIVSHIGVSNYPLINILDMLTYCKIKPAVNQIEVHPYNSREELILECQRLGIHVTAYSPLGSGVGATGPLGDGVIGGIAQALGCSPGQVILSWIVQQGVSVIPKSVKAERIKANAQMVKLSPEQMKEISGLNKNMVTCDMRVYWQYPIHYGKTIT